MMDDCKATYFLSALQFLQHFRYLFDFKLTEFFVHRPYERIPSTWVDYLSSNLASLDFGKENDVSQETRDQSLPANVNELFLNTKDMPSDLKRFIADAASLTFPREPLDAGTL